MSYSYGKRPFFRFKLDEWTIADVPVLVVPLQLWVKEIVNFLSNDHGFKILIHFEVFHVKEVFLVIFRPVKFLAVKVAEMESLLNSEQIA